MEQKDITEVYEIREQIGQGGYGKVYKAIHRESGVTRAIKKIKRKNLDYDNQKHLLSEFESLKKLDHPNIVKLIEHYEDKDHIFLVQEYLSGL